MEGRREGERGKGGGREGRVEAARKEDPWKEGGGWEEGRIRREREEDAVVSREWRRM